MKMKQLSLAMLCALGAVGVGMPAHAQTAAGLDVLLQQAEFWHARNRDELAQQTLQRALQVQPDSEEAMYRLGLYALPADPKTAEHWLQRLRDVNPSSSFIPPLEGELASQSLDRSRLPDIRALAAKGNSAAAADGYRALFKGAPPPRDLALEYYQTLAGDPRHWQEARVGLEGLLADRPNDVEVRAALGQMLTYREETRRQGLALLSPLATRVPEARNAWRQGLLWLDVKPADEPLYAAYAEAYPNDDEVLSRFVKAVEARRVDPGDQARVDAYAALKAGQIDKAISAFTDSVKRNDKDADAWGGLGIAQLRAGNYKAARESLARAGKLAPAKRNSWAEALASAEFFEKMRAAETLRDRGRFSEAEAAVRDLANRAGDRGRAAKLLLADIETKAGNPADAERTYRQLLAENLSDDVAVSGLYGAFMTQGKRGEAADLLRRYPSLSKGRVEEIQQLEALSLRDKADSLRKQGDNEGAAKALSEALALAPENPWIRLAYARLLVANKDPRQARMMIEPLESGPANVEALHAAALFASEQGRWDDASRYLARIPQGRERNTELEELRARVALNGKLVATRQAVASRNTVVARHALRDLYDNAPSDFASRGQVAAALAELGEPGLALTLVRTGLGKEGGTRPVSDYLSYVSVLGRTGQVAEADALMRTLEQRSDLSADDAEQLQTLRNGFAVTQADRQRQAGDLAGAYDTLMANLATTPSDRSLLLAMGRLYDSGQMPREASTVYDAVLREAPGDPDAVRGAVTASLSNDDPDRASRILSRATPALDETTGLVLSAKVAAARGDNRRAIALLESAQRKHQPAAVGGQQPGTLLPVIAANGNPFRNEPFAGRMMASGVGALPSTWVAAQDPAGASNPFGDSNDPMRSADPLGSEIAQTLGEIREKTATYVTGGAEIRVRDGDAGLSQLTEIKSPMRLSMVPLDSGRLEFSATPTFIDGGRAGTEAGRRFGSVSVASGRAYLAYADAQQGYNQARSQIEQNFSAYNQAFQEEFTRLLGNGSILTPQQRADARAAAQAAAFDRVAGDVTDPALRGQLYEQLVNSTQAQVLSSLSDPALLAAAERLGAARRGIASAPTPENLQDSGVGFSLGYRSDEFSADIGSTPLGFQQTNVLGGVSWTPKVGQNGRVTVGLDRRSVTDSVLSYAGAKDPVSGQTWGGVTKTGVNFQYAYDSGDAGFYVGNDFHLYRGKNVDNNHAIGFNTGAYLRPIRTKNEELQTGVNLNWQRFDKNLGGYTLGHGGYFSPQSYVGLSFPVQYTLNKSQWEMKLRGAVGYQSFTQDSSPYFPKDKALQSELEQLETQVAEAYEGLRNSGSVIAPPSIRSRYESSSESGLAFNGGASLEYKIGKQTRLGGTIAYDSFGDYSETSGSIYLKHSMEALP